MSSRDWPPLPYAEWEATRDTVHMWTQIVGKTRLALTPLENHWWNVPLYVTPLGLGTSAIPYRDGSFEVEFDFVAHRLALRASDGREYALPLYARSVSDFYAEYRATLRCFGIEVALYPVPVEFDDTTPFDRDEHHAAYDRAHVERFRVALGAADRVLKQFRGRFLGKCSPVHFFWGSFDLAVTRFSGRPAPVRPEADRITRAAWARDGLERRT